MSNNITYDYDVVIIGAGPSGSVAAAILLQKGYSVCVVEKQTFPRFSIGESLLPQCMEFLHEAGLLDVVNAHGFQKRMERIFIGKANIHRLIFQTKAQRGHPIHSKSFAQILIKL